MSFENIKQNLFRIQNRLLILYSTLGIPKTKNSNYLFIGNSYSGYWFPDNLLDSNGTIWGVGLGLDSSFELALAKKGFEFLGFEPESKSFRASQQQFIGVNCKIYPFGLWDKDGQFDSFGTNISIVNIFSENSKNESKLEIRNIHEVAKELNLGNQLAPRILKLNIEGAEKEILFSLIRKPIDFEVMIFQAEFLLHLSFLRIFKKFKEANNLKKILRGLNKSGYILSHWKKNQFTLIHKSLNKHEVF